MNSLLPVIGVLFAAAITPGPNNIIVMHAGARGMAPAIAAASGIIVGSLLLLVLTWLGIGLAMSAVPAFTFALHVLGSAYLAWMGFALLARDPATASGAAVPSTTLGIAVFQLLNPKAWLLVIAAVSAMPQDRSFAWLAILMVVVTSTCLAVWAWAGTAATRMFARPGARRLIDRILGAVLLLAALGILADVWEYL